MSLDKTQVIEHLLGLCRSDIEKRYGEQALDIHNAKLTFEKNRCVRTLFPKSSCRRCVEACREKAIFLNNGTIGLENIKCTVAGSRIKCFIIVTVFSCSARYVISSKKADFRICTELSC